MLSRGCPSGSNRAPPCFAGTVDAGYSGKVTATTTDPYYSEDVAGTQGRTVVPSQRQRSGNVCVSAVHVRIVMIESVPERWCYLAS